MYENQKRYASIACKKKGGGGTGVIYRQSHAYNYIHVCAYITSSQLTWDQIHKVNHWTGHLFIS